MLYSRRWHLIKTLDERNVPKISPKWVEDMGGSIITRSLPTLQRVAIALARSLGDGPKRVRRTCAPYAKRRTFCQFLIPKDQIGSPFGGPVPHLRMQLMSKSAATQHELTEFAEVKRGELSLQKLRILGKRASDNGWGTRTPAWSNTTGICATKTAAEDCADRLLGSLAARRIKSFPWRR